MTRSVKVVTGLLAVGLAGCYWSQSTRSESSGAASREQLEAKLEGQLEFKEVTLEQQASGRYSGVATGKDGAAYQLKVTVTNDVVEYEAKSKGRPERQGALSWRKTERKATIAGVAP